MRPIDAHKIKELIDLLAEAIGEDPEPTQSSDLIKRSDAIKAIEDVAWFHQNRDKDMVSGASDEGEAWYRAQDIYDALDKVPTAKGDDY